MFRIIFPTEPRKFPFSVFLFSITAETREITQHPDEACKKAKYATRANRVECESCNCVSY